MIVSLCTLCSVCVVMCLASHTMGRILHLRCSFHILYMYLHLLYIQLYTLVLMHTGFIYACCDVTFLYFIYVYTFTLYTIMHTYADVHLIDICLPWCTFWYFYTNTYIYLVHMYEFQGYNKSVIVILWLSSLQVPSYWTQHNFCFSRFLPSSK